MRTALLVLLALLCLGGAAYLWISDHAYRQASEHTPAAIASTKAGPSAVEDSVSESMQQPATDRAFPPASQLPSTAHATEGGIDPVPPNDIFTRAVDAFDAGRYDEAKALFLKVADHDARALSGAGISAFKLRDWESAIQHLSDAVRRGQDGFLEHKFLALSYNRMDDLDRSLSHANTALARQEDHEMELLRSRLRREREAREGFIAEETEHFRTLYDGYTVNRRIMDVLEEAYRDIGSRLDFFPDGTVTVVLYAQKDFFDVTRLPAWTAGAFDGRIHLPVRGIEDTEDPVLRTVLYHEYVHALVHRMAGGVPHWLNEGLAEYLVDRGLPRTGQVIPLRSLEQAFPLDDNHGMMDAYAVSHSAVAHLVEEHGLWRMREFLLGMGRGLTLDEAFQEAFSTPYEDFLADWGRTQNSRLHICGTVRYPV